ncbi:MAG: efflux RND transporter periplasmic adaptor subunit [Nitrosomonadales bacterium]|nr:efflux RND transporter periplasmic adaptor subunit [Nitrosomonadales bacterium]
MHTRRRAGVALAAMLLIALAASAWLWHGRSKAAKIKETGAIQVVSAPVAQNDVPVRLTANGTVSALQTVEVRPQVSALVKAVHIKEGQFVRKGELLFTLDARTEEANLSRAGAQVAKDRADLLNAERNLERLRELYRQEFISQSEFDLAQNQVDGLRNQLAIDQASVEASRVARGFSEITAPVAGRTGAISIYPGSLVQPNGAALLSITQINPINVSFTLPERALADLQQALAQGEVPVSAKLDLPGQSDMKGRLVFVDNAVDTASGTIRLKAEFSNPDNRLWPGMFVTVALAPRTLTGAITVPVQAVQTGPEKKFLYVIGEDSKVVSLPVNVRLIQDDIAVIEGIAPGARVVVEGAQNLRPGDTVAEPEGKGRKAEDGKGVEKGGANLKNASKQ